MIRFVNFNELGAGQAFLHGSTKFRVEEGYFLDRFYNAVDIKTGELYEFDADDNVCAYNDVEILESEEVPV